MEIDMAAQVLFGKDYEELNEKEAEEAHNFREWWDERHTKKIVHDEIISQNAWWES